MPVNIVIIGVGLIGGSLGLALRESPLVNMIVGVDSDRETLKKAQAIGAIDCAASLEEGVERAEVIFLCTPLGSYSSLVNKIKPFLKPGTIVTDVGSTKYEVMNIFQELPVGVWAVGGHPMAGAEIRGIKGADRYLFENAVYVLTPRADTPPEILQFLTKLLETIGARIKIMDTARHDELVAVVSHIPHLTAAALVNLTENKEDNLMMAAGGFRDITRIASSNPELWGDILFFNRDALLSKLDALIGRLNDMKQILQADDRELMRWELGEAKKIRDQIPHTRRGLLPSFSDLVCIVPDQPGIIGRLGFILGEQSINIVDIEILRVREGDGGTIRLGVPSAEDARKAVKILQNQGIKAWIQ